MHISAAAYLNLTVVYFTSEPNYGNITVLRSFIEC